MYSFCSSLPHLRETVLYNYEPKSKHLRSHPNYSATPRGPALRSPASHPLVSRATAQQIPGASGGSCCLQGPQGPVFSIMASAEKTEECPFTDIFNEDETERNYLLSKPTCFIIFGKPGSGKTTLARNIAQAWKCIHVEALSVLEEHITTKTETGTMLQSLLVSGHSIPDELVTRLILEKLKSQEVSHFGYIITEIPTLAQDTMTTLKQLEFVKNLELQPDVIINIKCGDYDLCQRVSGQRQHSSTGHIYNRDQWDPEIIESSRRRKKDPPKDGKAKGEEEEEEQEEEEKSVGLPFFKVKRYSLRKLCVTVS